MRALAVGGADLVVVPQAGAAGEWPEGLYEGEMRVAAFQNGYYVALCNRVGQRGLPRLRRRVVRLRARRRGHRARRRRAATRFCIADIDLAATAKSHARAAVPEARRPELYAVAGSATLDRSTSGSEIATGARSHEATVHKVFVSYVPFVASMSLLCRFARCTRDRTNRSNSHNCVSRFEYGPGV